MQRRMFIGLYTCPCRKKTERRLQIELDKNIYIYIWTLTRWVGYSNQPNPVLTESREARIRRHDNSPNKRLGCGGIISLRDIYIYIYLYIYMYKRTGRIWLLFWCLDGQHQGFINISCEGYIQQQCCIYLYICTWNESHLYNHCNPTWILLSFFLRMQLPWFKLKGLWKNIYAKYINMDTTMHDQPLWAQQVHNCS